MKLAFDISLMRPGCVILAAAMDADPVASQAFPAELWLTAPTPGMTVYETTTEQLEMLVWKVKDANNS